MRSDIRQVGCIRVHAGGNPPAPLTRGNACYAEAQRGTATTGGIGRNPLGGAGGDPPRVGGAMPVLTGN